MSGIGKPCGANVEDCRERYAGQHGAVDDWVLQSSESDDAVSMDQPVYEEDDWIPLLAHKQLWGLEKKWKGK